MTPEEAREYVAKRKAQSPNLAPLSFINLVIAELWLEFGFRTCVGETRLPIDGVSIDSRSGMVIYHVAEPFDLIQYYMKHAA